MADGEVYDTSGEWEDGEPVQGKRPARRGNVEELVRFLPDLVRMLGRLVRDPRVPRSAKIVTGGVIAYLLSPIDIVPDFLPGVGALDDVYLAIWAVRYLLNAAGYEVVKECWPGSDDGFALLLVVVGQDR